MTFCTRSDASAERGENRIANSSPPRETRARTPALAAACVFFLATLGCTVPGELGVDAIAVEPTTGDDGAGSAFPEETDAEVMDADTVKEMNHSEPPG